MDTMAETSGTASSLSAILQKISTDLEQESTLKEVRRVEADLSDPLIEAGKYRCTIQSIKESLQPLDTVSRNVTALLNRSHSTPGDQRESSRTTQV